MSRAWFTMVVVAMLLMQGCSVIIAGLPWGVDPNLLPVGSDREKVISKLGQPIDSRVTSDGGHVDAFRYKIYRPGQRLSVSKNEVEGYLFLNALTLGGVELLMTSLVIVDWVNHPRNEVQVGFGPDGRVIWIGSPPPYGPIDDVIPQAPLSVGAIRESCWSWNVEGDVAVTSEDRYIRCVTLRLAIWGAY